MSEPDPTPVAGAPAPEGEPSRTSPARLDADARVSLDEAVPIPALPPEIHEVVRAETARALRRMGEGAARVERSLRSLETALDEIRARLDAMASAPSVDEARVAALVGASGRTIVAAIEARLAEIESRLAAALNVVLSELDPGFLASFGEPLEREPERARLRRLFSRRRRRRARDAARLDAWAEPVAVVVPQPPPAPLAAPVAPAMEPDPGEAPRVKTPATAGRRPARRPRTSPDPKPRAPRGGAKGSVSSKRRTEGSRGAKAFE